MSRSAAPIAGSRSAAAHPAVGWCASSSSSQAEGCTALARRAARAARRPPPKFERAAGISEEYGYGDFATAEAELTRWMDDRRGSRGTAPRRCPRARIARLRERQVLLPGTRPPAFEQVASEEAQRRGAIPAAPVHWARTGGS
jgi:hypothetical protein